MLPTALRAARAPLRPARALSSRRWAPRAVAPPPESAALREKARIIFGNLPSTNQRSGNKVLRKKLKGPLLADYYFDQSGVDVDVLGREIFKGWLNEVEARRKNQLELLRRRGKGPPKKGQGKRAKR
mmetsp:Transcript_18133/g.53916  ORF Transcript_18133/g.53916 Transcript_18133/m.53916 type:complete len:127 (-) Transcript_18133:40-420(-)